MKIDCHAHILPHSWPNLKDKYGYGGFIYMDHQADGTANMMHDDGTFFRKVNQNCWDPNEIIKDMDKYQVDKMVLCTVPVLFNYWAKPIDALDWSQILNNHIAQLQNDYPTRFIALGTLPMQDVELSMQELKRLKSLGVKGVQIGSHIQEKNLDGKSFFPLWQLFCELDMCLFVHPWDMMGQDKMKNFFLPWLVGMPAETSLAICSMIFGGVFDTFPQLRVLFAHGGGSFPFTVGRVSHGWQARQDLCNVNNIQDPYKYLGKFWVDGITHDTNALHFLLQTMGDTKVAYGTDYPFPLGDLAHGAFIENDNRLSTTQKNNLLSQSVLSWLNM